MITQRWTAFGAALALVGAAAAVATYVLLHRSARSNAAPPPVAPPVAYAATTQRATRPTVRFSDITDEAGIDFVHTSGSYGQKLLPETMGPGCAFIDYDQDGSPDIFFVNSRRWADDPRGPADPPATLALYHNDGHGYFVNVTEATGLAVSMFGMGVTVGDYDNDGYPDLFVTGLDGNRLFHNEKGQKFREVTAGDLAVSKGWATGAAFFDANNDGNLDLFVCYYVDWSPDKDRAQAFTIEGLERSFGPPISFGGTLCQLLRGDGAGKFVDVSEQSGIQKFNANTQAPMGKSLGVVATDLDRDGWMDVLVTNDTVQNFLFHNLGDGRFEEVGAQAGIAFDRDGKTRGAMGIDVAEYRDDQKVGIAIGNFANEPTGFYVNQDSTRLLFADKAMAEGVGPPSQRWLKFGLFFFDYDLDGRPDLLTANGHLEEEIGKVQASQTYAQPPQLFWNCGTDERFVFVPVTSEDVGDDLFKPMVGRGAAYADIDGDGDLDMLLTANGGPPRLLRNDGGNRHHWLRVRLEGSRSNRSAIGARVELRIGDVVRHQEVMGGRSYLSQPELVLTFGLGDAKQADELTVFWLGGGKQTLRDIHSDQLLHVRQATNPAP